MNFSKTLAPGLQELEIQLMDPLNEPMVLENGVFVPCGKRPTGEALRQLNVATEEEFGITIAERRIPENQSTEGVLLGDFLDYGISPVTLKPINSEHVNNCIVINAVGVAINGSHHEEQRGLYVHVNPAILMLKTEFRARYAERIKAMQESTHQFTRDVAFLGGALSVENPDEAVKTARKWLGLVELLQSLSEPLDVEPTVMRPSLRDTNTFVSLDTQQRVVQVRPSEDEGINIPDEIFPRFVLASHARENLERLLSALQWKC